MSNVTPGTLIQASHTARMQAMYGTIEKARVIESIEPPPLQSPYDFLQNKFTPLLEKANDEQKAKLKKVFDEYGEGKLHSGSKDGPKVTNHKQAVAIALHESGLAKSRDEADKMVDDADKMEAINEKEEEHEDALKKSFDHILEKGGKNSGKRKLKEGDPVLFIHPTSKEVTKGKIVKTDMVNKEGMHDVKAGDETHYVHQDNFIKDNSDKYRAMDDDKLKKEIAQLETFYNAEGDKMKKFYMKHELNVAKEILLARSSKGDYKNLYKKKMEKGIAYGNNDLGLSHAERMLVTYGHDEIIKAKFTGEERGKLADKDEAEGDGSYPIRNVSDLHNAIKAYGRSKDKEKTKNWIKKRAKELGHEKELPEDWEKAAGGGSMEVGEGFAMSTGQDDEKVREKKKQESGAHEQAVQIEKSDADSEEVDESMEKSLTAEIVTLHSTYMSFDNYMTKAKVVPIGTLDKGKKFVKTADGWKPVKTHGHLVDKKLEENKRHNFEDEEGGGVDHGKHKEFVKEQDKGNDKKKKISNIDEAMEADKANREKQKNKKDEQEKHLREVEKHNSK